MPGFRQKLISGQARTGHTGQRNQEMARQTSITASAIIRGQAVAVHVPAGDGVVPLGVARDKSEGRVPLCRFALQIACFGTKCPFRCYSS
jgi:hypothetical protein